MSNREKNQKRGSIKPTDAVLLLENLLTRERFSLASWDTRAIELELGTLKRIVEAGNWNSEERKHSKNLIRNLDELIKIVQEKDATRVDAGHTHVAKALTELRKEVFGI